MFSGAGEREVRRVPRLAHGNRRSVHDHAPRLSRACSTRCATRASSGAYDLQTGALPLSRAHRTPPTARPRWRATAGSISRPRAASPGLEGRPHVRGPGPERHGRDRVRDPGHLARDDVRAHARVPLCDRRRGASRREPLEPRTPRGSRPFQATLRKRLRDPASCFISTTSRPRRTPTNCVRPTWNAKCNCCRDALPPAGARCSVYEQEHAQPSPVAGDEEGRACTSCRMAERTPRSGAGPRLLLHAKVRLLAPVSRSGPPVPQVVNKVAALHRAPAWLRRLRRGERNRHRAGARGAASAP